MMHKKPLNILLAEDDEDDRLFFKSALDSLEINYNLKMVHDGEDLLNYILSENNIPDILFLDINMPKKNGMECLSEIRTHQKFRTMPIAIFSTSVCNSHIEDTFIKGANLYINKPNDFNTMKLVLNKVITKINLFDMVSNKETFLIKI